MAIMVRRRVFMLFSGVRKTFGLAASRGDLVGRESEEKPDSYRGAPSRSNWGDTWRTAVLTTFLALLSTLIMNSCSNREKARWIAYEKKEARYKELLKAARVFQSPNDFKTKLELHKKFLEEVDVCLMYCSDEVLQQTYGFIDRMRPANNYTKEEQDIQLRQMMAAIRRDVFKELGAKTNFMAKDVYTTSLYVTQGVLAEIESGHAAPLSDSASLNAPARLADVPTKRKPGRMK